MNGNIIIFYAKIHFHNVRQMLLWGKVGKISLKYNLTVKIVLAAPICCDSRLAQRSEREGERYTQTTRNLCIAANTALQGGLQLKLIAYMKGHIDRLCIIANAYITVPFESRTVGLQYQPKKYLFSTGNIEQKYLQKYYT